MAGVDGRAVENYGAGVVVLRGELEIVGCGVLAYHGCGGGGPAADGEEKGAVGDSVAGEGDEGWGVGSELAMVRSPLRSRGLSE